MRSRTENDSGLQEQLALPFGPIRNNEFLSNHWLEHRLPLEPEWRDLEGRAKETAEKLIELWRIEKDRAQKYGDEAGLEQKLIQPVFESLGWQIKYQTFLQGREPDYALFLSPEDLDRALDAGRRNPDFWSHATLVADAKAWHINLDRPSRVGARREYPPEQIEWYLDRSRRDYGILTNGRLWRLVPRVLGPNKPRFQTYLEVDLVRLLDEVTRPSAQLQLGPGGEEFDTFLRFFLLFSPHGFEFIDGRKPLITRAVEGSSEYSLGVSEELKERVFEALRLCVEGFIKFEPNGLVPAGDLPLCQEHGFVFLYRLLFIMYGEDRGLLPYRINPTYTRNRSLARHRDDVATKLDNVRKRLDRSDYSREDTSIWDDLQDLFDLIDRGHRRYGVPAYNGGLFNLENNPFLSEKKLPDWYLARVLDQLGRAPQPGRADLGLFRVDYRDLAIQQLGSVYEGLLELRPRYASEAMKVVRQRQAGSREERVLRVTDQVPRGYEATDILYDADSIYLATDKGERRRSGSYYTPDHIVNHMIEGTLGPLCIALDQTLQDEIRQLESDLASAEARVGAGLEQRIEALRADFDNRILRLKVLDPAMGSGHFLIRACQYLAEEIATNPNTGHPESEAMQSDESTITYWKRRVAETCLFGVDFNPMAVELAKLALWLETIGADAPLTFLDHHFQCGDSIIGARINWLNNLPGEKGLLEGEFEQQVEAALPAILEPLAEISNLPSDTAEQVKRKETLFKRRFMPALRRFATIADFWCASVIGVGEPISGDNYRRLVDALDSRKRFNAVLSESWARDCLDELTKRGIHFFHWELAFPQVFLNHKHDLSTLGFDVVIGNPPYDVVSEKEAGAHVIPLKKFIAYDESLGASRVGKNNLYKLFICRALELVRDGGYLSFIVPMPLLGDEQASGVRKALLEHGAFAQIHTFPQKDNPARRVFFEAKLSTTLFVHRKGDQDNQSCIAAVHRAQFIETNSPSLSFNTAAVALYDPSNMTIVSCSQEDWDLATEIVKRPGISRLGRFCKSYQGEVNETTQKDFLNEHETKGRRLVLRGSNVCLYVLRAASQGQSLYIDVEAFREGKHPNSKAFHGIAERIGFQRSSPQNNFRRVIAARIPAGELCFDTVSYIPSDKATLLSFDFLLAILNSKLTDWYFRLGSTNSKVNEYQFKNLPCPVFRDKSSKRDDDLMAEVHKLIDTDVSVIPDLLEADLVKGPFSVVVRDTLEALSRKIQITERARGEISRHDRAHLDSEAQPFQDAIDLMLFRMAGLSKGDIAGVEDRLTRML